MNATRHLIFCDARCVSECALCHLTHCLSFLYIYSTTVALVETTFAESAAPKRSYVPSSAPLHPRPLSRPSVFATPALMSSQPNHFDWQSLLLVCRTCKLESIRIEFAALFIINFTSSFFILKLISHLCLLSDHSPGKSSQTVKDLTLFSSLFAVCPPFCLVSRACPFPDTPTMGTKATVLLSHLAHH